MLGKFRYTNCSQRRAFPVPCCPRADMKDLNEIRTAISSENIQFLQSQIATYSKKFEEVVFIEEGFLYKKISKKDVYVKYGATADIPQDAVKELRFDSNEVGQTNHYYSCVSQQPSFESFFCFLLGSDGDARLDFAFLVTLSQSVSATLSVLD